MLGLDPLTAGALMIMAASQKNLCEMPKPTQINVTPETEEIEYDFKQDMADLQEYEMDTIDPYGFHGLSVTQGFMQGAIQMTPSVKIAQETIPKYGAACLWYDTIDITIKIDPKIVVAKEVAKDRCMKKAVLEHEQKHVTADRKIVNKYAKIMGKKVYDALQERGFLVGPIKVEYVQPTAQRMQKIVFQIIEHESKKMDLERTEVQRAIDSRDEYDSVNAKCPKFEEKRNALIRK